MKISNKILLTIAFSTILILSILLSLLISPKVEVDYGIIQIESSISNYSEELINQIKRDYKDNINKVVKITEENAEAEYSKVYDKQALSANIEISKSDLLKSMRDYDVLSNRSIYLIYVSKTPNPQNFLQYITDLQRERPVNIGFISINLNDYEYRLMSKDIVDDLNASQGFQNLDQISHYICVEGDRILPSEGKILECDQVKTYDGRDAFKIIQSHMDDSVGAYEYVYVFEKIDGGYKISEIRERFRCQSDRGHQTFGLVYCV